MTVMSGAFTTTTRVTPLATTLALMDAASVWPTAWAYAPAAVSVTWQIRVQAAASQGVLSGEGLVEVRHLIGHLPERICLQELRTNVSAQRATPTQEYGPRLVSFVPWLTKKALA